MTLPRNKSAIKLSLFYFFFFAYVGVLMIYMPNLLHSLGYSPWQIGVVFAAIPLVRFLSPFLFLKHLRVTQQMYVMSNIIFFLLALSFFVTIHHFWLFLLNHLLLGFCVTVILPYIETTALSDLGKERYGKVRLYGSVGFILVALGMASLSEELLIVLSVFALIVALTVLSALSVAHEEEAEADRKPEEGKKQFDLFAHWPFWANLFLMQMSFGAFYNFFTIYETEHGISMETISWLWTFGVVCEIGMFLFQGYLLKKHRLSLLVQLTTFATALRWLLLYLFPASLPFVFISQGFHALSFALYHTAVIAYLHQIYVRKNLAQQFYSGIAYGLGLMAGSLVAGAVYGEYLFLISAGIALLAGVILFLEHRSGCSGYQPGQSDA